MAKIKKLKIFYFARFQALIGALIGLAAGLIYSFGGLLIDILVTLGWVTSSQTPGLSYGTILAFGALLGMPIIGILIGLVTGLIGAILYNFFAKWFGGITTFEE